MGSLFDKLLLAVQWLMFLAGAFLTSSFVEDQRYGSATYMAFITLLSLVFFYKNL